MRHAARPPLRKLLLIVAAASLFGAGCALFASHSQYGKYRAVRVAADDQGRLRAMHQYVSEYPDGHWAKSIQEERVEREPSVWDESRGTIDGLRFYLEAFPDGPHAEQARPMLAALEQVAGNREGEAERARRVENERREALLEKQRTWLTRASQFWTRTLVGITNWGSPIGDVARANPAFSRAFGSAPRPRCSRLECIKFYASSYSIPVPGATRVDRQIEMFLRLRMNDQRVVRAEILLPNKGFSRWYEQENRTIVVDEDPTQRQEAINWALERILPALREVAPNATPMDVVPEPIDPPTVRAPNQPEEGASLAPGDAPPPTDIQPAESQQQQGQQQQGQQQQGQQQDGGTGNPLEDLLNRATGTEAPLTAPTPQERPDPTPEPTPEPETMVLPIALQGYRVAGLRIVLFAASEEDYGRAYDGLFVEYEAPQGDQPRRPPRRGRRR